MHAENKFTDDINHSRYIGVTEMGLYMMKKRYHGSCLKMLPCKGPLTTISIRQLVIIRLFFYVHEKRISARLFDELCIVFVRTTGRRPQGRIQDFKLGGAHFKKIAPSGGRRKIFWGISSGPFRMDCTT